MPSFEEDAGEGSITVEMVEAYGKFCGYQLLFQSHHDPHLLDFLMKFIIIGAHDYLVGT